MTNFILNSKGEFLKLKKKKKILHVQKRNYSYYLSLNLSFLFVWKKNISKL